MSHQVSRALSPTADSEWLALGRRIVRQEGEALLRLAAGLDDAFLRAAGVLAACQGCVLVTGVGKAGRIGQKVADTLASTGTVSHFLHPAEALHGDLGRVRPQDVVLALSKSGETDEIVRLIEPLRSLRAALLAITENASSTLGRAATACVTLGPVEEACPLGLAPSTSTTLMLAAGDALALVVSRMRGFRAEDFARYHPGGTLGRQLARVRDCMRPLRECRVDRDDRTVRQVLIAQGRPGRRVGAVMLCGPDGRLTGFLTDSDVARLLESGRDQLLDAPAHQVMTRNPATLRHDAPMSEAVRIMVARHFSELPIVDERGCPVGLIDRADLGCLVPGEDEPPAVPPAPIGIYRGPHFES